MSHSRVLSFFFVLLLLPFSLFSCKNTEKYRDSLSSEELARDAEAVLSDTDFLSVGAEHLSDYVTLPSFADDVTICLSTDGNRLDEFGIWHTDLQNADAAKDLFSEYLSTSLDRNRTFFDSYIPEETPKLRDAEVRVYGSYVAYAILDAPHRKLFFDTIEAALKQA